MSINRKRRMRISRGAGLEERWVGMSMGGGDEGEDEDE